MSDPRSDRDPNFRDNGRYETASDSGSTLWISLIVAVVVILGFAAYTYRDQLTASSSGNSTTAGQSMRPQAPATPAAPTERR
jgi:flagellar basal body-associated protein FliL